MPVYDALTLRIKSSSVSDTHAQRRARARCMAAETGGDAGETSQHPATRAIGIADDTSNEQTPDAAVSLGA